MKWDGMEDEGVRIIKKYPNRRLYDTKISSYITLLDAKTLVLTNEPFRVLDVKTSEDVTRTILLQIILEEEAGNNPIFSSSVLIQIIRFHGQTMQSIMGPYLEKALMAFVDMQKKFQDQSRSYCQPEDKSARLNMEFFSQFLSVQAPFLQSVVSSYIEQSGKLFFEVQGQMQESAHDFFKNFSLTSPFPQKNSKEETTSSSFSKNDELSE